MISEWKCFDVRELKQRRRRRQRERQKSNRFRRTKQQLCTCNTLYIPLPSLYDYDVKCLITRFVENVNTRQQLYFSFPELRYSLLEFNSKKNSPHLTKWTRWNKRDKVWSGATSLLFPYPSPSLLLTLPIITSSLNLFYMEMSGEFVRDYWIQEACTSVLFLPHTSWVQPVSSGSSISGATGR